MDFGLRGKTALVFGGSKGLGRGCAEALAAEGVNVVLVARGAEAVRDAADHIARTYGVAAVGHAADSSDADAVEHVIAAVEQRFGGIDILVNNTGGPPPSGVVGVAPEVWLAQFQAMVASIVRITDRVLPGMRARGWGRVLTIASTTVVEPVAALGLSNTLRAALVGWSKTLAGEVARDGITANLLLPGHIATDRVAFLDGVAAQRRGSDVETVQKEKLIAIPAGRYGTPAEFGAVAAFLASRQAAYVTGSMIRIDGGAVRSV